MKTIISLMIVLASSICYAEESTLQKNASVKGDLATLRVQNGTIVAHDINGYSVNGKDTLPSIIAVQCSSVDDDGTILVTGGFWGTVCFGDSVCTSMKNSYDCFVVRYAPNGALLWLRVIATNGTEIGHGVAPDSSGKVYVVGEFSDSNWTRFAYPYPNGYPSKTGTDGFLASYDPTGMICKRSIIVSGGGTNAAFSVATDTDRNVYVSGVFRGTATIGDRVRSTMNSSIDSGDVFMLKISPSGKYLITQTWGTEFADERGVDISVGNSDGSVWIIFDIDTMLPDSSRDYLVYANYGLHLSYAPEGCDQCRKLYAGRYVDAVIVHRRKKVAIH